MLSSVYASRQVTGTDVLSLNWIGIHSRLTASFVSFPELGYYDFTVTLPVFASTLGPSRSPSACRKGLER